MERSERAGNNDRVGMESGVQGEHSDLERVVLGTGRALREMQRK